MTRRVGDPSAILFLHTGIALSNDLLACFGKLIITLECDAIDRSAPCNDADVIFLIHSKRHTAELSEESPCNYFAIKIATILALARICSRISR